jgi:hypothetical protein
MRANNQTGQLLLPILGVLFMFGIFWVSYVLWCQTIYWKMRMDVVSDLVALSAVREQAVQLNELATFQGTENLFLQKAKVFSKNIAHMQVTARDGFEAENHLMRLVESQFENKVWGVAQIIAKENGADLPAEALMPYGHQLAAQAVHIFYFADWLPVGERNYPSAYYTRTWSPKKTCPQPPHETQWLVCHKNICEDGRARLWLDARPDDILNNGGFPSAEAPFLRSIGIQCFYPQFNARLLSKH